MLLNFKKKLLLALLFFNFYLSANTILKSSLYVAGSLVAISGSIWIYKRIKRDNIKNQLDESSKVYQKIQNKFSKELVTVKESQLTKDKLSNIADKIPFDLFSKYLQEINFSIKECERHLSMAAEIKVAYEKKEDEINLLANDIYESLTHLVQQLEIYNNFLNKHKSFFILRSLTKKLNESYQKELEINSELTPENLNVIILQKCCETTSAYPYVTYMERVLANSKEFDQILSEFYQTSELKDQQLLPLSNDALKLKNMFDQIRKNIALSSEYQKQRKQYQEIQRAQILMEVEQKKLQAEEQKNLIEFKKLEEIKKANLIKEKLLKEQENNRDLLQEIFNKINNLNGATNSDEAKEKLESIKRQLTIVKERISRPLSFN